MSPVAQCSTLRRFDYTGIISFDPVAAHLKLFNLNQDVPPIYSVITLGQFASFPRPNL